LRQNNVDVAVLGTYLETMPTSVYFLTCDNLPLDWSVQHASSDVEKMVLGNKCDMEDRRLVSKERGTQVEVYNSGWFCVALSCVLIQS